MRLIKNIDYNINGELLKIATRESVVKKMVEEIDPILVSKYMVFSDDWLKIIGNDRSRQVTRQQFKTWTDSLDKVYECYKEFMGKGPRHMDAVFVDALSGGLAITSREAIRVNLGWHDMSTRLKEIRQGRPTYIMLHEMGHVFSMAYALEQGGFKMCTETGPKYRYGIVNNALQNYRMGNIDDFQYEEG